MLLLAIFTNAFIVGLSGAMMPGPLLTINISASLKRGFWAGPLVVLGHAIAEIFVLLAIYLGVTQLISDPQIFYWIAVIGGVCLILLGLLMLIEILRKKVKLEFITKKHHTRKKTVLLGGLVSISSPYWILWWLTVGTVLITQAAAFGFVGLLIFYFGHILSDLVWYSIVSFLIARGKRFFNNFIYQSLITICALFLIWLGYFFISSAVSGNFITQLKEII